MMSGMIGFNSSVMSGCQSLRSQIIGDLINNSEFDQGIAPHAWIRCLAALVCPAEVVDNFCFKFSPDIDDFYRNAELLPDTLDRVVSIRGMFRDRPAFSFKTGYKVNSNHLMSLLLQQESGH